MTSKLLIGKEISMQKNF